MSSRFVTPTGSDALGAQAALRGGKGETCDASLGVGGARGDGAAPAGRDGGVCGRGLGAGGDVAKREVRHFLSLAREFRLNGARLAAVGDELGAQQVRAADRYLAQAAGWREQALAAHFEPEGWEDYGLRAIVEAQEARS